MKRLGITLLAMAASAAVSMTASAAVLFDNSNIVTGTGNGFSGANTSTIDAASSSTYGFTSNGTTNFALAEDFTISSGASVSLITFDAYSTSTYPSPPASPFTGAAVSIWSAQPGTAGATVLFTSSTLATTAWTGAYRVTSTTLTNAQRPVFTLGVSFANVSLTAGTYWASFDVTGVAAPGNSASVFTPPVMNANGTQPNGNGIQSADGGVTWAPVADATFGTGARLPLTVVGTAAVPEPTTVAMLMLAGVGAVVAARRRVARA